MKPFNTKPFSESDLIAYHLHELSPRRARALEAAMQADPSLAAESDAYATMLNSFKGGATLDVDEEMMDRNWSRIAAKLPSAPLRSPRFSRWLVPATAGLAFAATAFFVSTQRPTHVSRPQSQPAEPAIAAATGNATSASPANSIATSPNGEAHSNGPLQNSLAQTATGSEAHIGNGVSHIDRDPFATSPAASLIARLHDTPPRSLPLMPEGEEPRPMLQYIPLAHAPQALPSALHASIADAPTATQQDASGVGTTSKQKQHTKHRDSYMEVTFAMGGTLTGTRNVSSDSNGELRTLGATHSITAIGSFHQQLRPAVGYRFTASYTSPDFQYFSRTNSTLSGSQTDIIGHVYEFAGTYVVQGPHRGRVSTTVEGGTALMAFLPQPNSYGITAGANLRAAGVAAVGAEVAVTKHIAINAGYRVHIYKGPDFRSTSIASDPQITTTLISQEPSVGISYRFTHK